MNAMVASAAKHLASSGIRLKGALEHIGNWLTAVPSYDSNGPTLRLIGRTASSDFERLLGEVIAETAYEGKALRALVIDRLADALAVELIDPWAWTLDSGVWWPWVVRAEVERELARLEGDFVISIAAQE